MSNTTAQATASPPDDGLEPIIVLGWQAYCKGYLEGHADAADGMEYHRDAANEGADQWCTDHRQQFVEALDGTELSSLRQEIERLQGKLEKARAALERAEAFIDRHNGIGPLIVVRQVLKDIDQ